MATGFSFLVEMGGVTLLSHPAHWGLFHPMFCPLLLLEVATTPLDGGGELLSVSMNLSPSNPPTMEGARRSCIASILSDCGRQAT